MSQAHSDEITRVMLLSGGSGAAATCSDAVSSDAARTERGNIPPPRGLSLAVPRGLSRSLVVSRGPSCVCDYGGPLTLTANGGNGNDLHNSGNRVLAFTLTYHLYRSYTACRSFQAG